MLELQDLTKIYNAGTVTEMTLFDHFNLTVPDGQFVSIVGSNGSGKTSLLNILCGSIPLDGGDVLLDGKSIRKQKDYQRYAIMGRVYQNPSLGTSPNLTMLENLSLADNKGKPFGLGFGVNKKRIDFYRSELAALDPKTAETIMVLTGKVVKEKGLTALMVTHNLRYAVEYGDRLLMLDHGKIVLDRAGEEKAATSTEELLAIFNRYSVM